MEKTLLVEYLNHHRNPLAGWADGATCHRRLCESAPEFYLHLLADARAELSQKRCILLNLITHPAARGTPRQRIVALLHRLPVVEALQVVEVLRTSMTNGHRACEIGRAFLLGHEQFPELAATHRQRVIRLLRHVLGERSWSSACRFLASSTPEGEHFLQRKLLRYAPDAAVAREALLFLAGVAVTPTHPTLVKSIAARRDIEQGSGLPRDTLFGLRERFQPKPPDSKIRYLAAVDAPPTRTDGPLTALYKKGFFGEQPPETLAQEATKRLAEMTAPLPQMDMRLALVLDLSGSMASSGERLYHPAALSLALARILQQRVRMLSFHQVGGEADLETGALPQPQGASDLAEGILAAARQHPQAILVISDGYENVRQGDADEVVRGLRLLGFTMPIYQVVPLFAATEDLSQRRLGNSLQVLPMEHEAGVSELLVRLKLSADTAPLSLVEQGQIQELLLVR